MAGVSVPRKPARSPPHDRGPLPVPGGASRPMSVAEGEATREAAAAPGRPSGARPADDGLQGRVVPFRLIAVQLALVLAAVRLYDVAAQNHFFPVLCIAAGGFLVHAWLPVRLRLPFFVLLSLGGLLFVLGC